MHEIRQVAIVGAAGKMGSWFCVYFARRGLDVSAYDIKKQKKRKTLENVHVKDSLDDCVKDADLVLICVPPISTPQAIRECVKKVKDGAIIAEISSVKRKTFAALKKVPSNLQPLCIHPMFGAGASEKIRTKVLLMPVRNQTAELKIANEIFDKGDVRVLANAEQHDKAIAIVLGLTYFANFVFARIMMTSSRNISMLKQAAGTTFGLQSLIAESILTDEPDLIIALLQENRYTMKYINKYIKAAAAIARLAVAKNTTDLKANILKVRSGLQKSQDLQQSYRRMYDIIENFK
jgi:prephenate dehydrogenase